MVLSIRTVGAATTAPPSGSSLTRWRCSRDVNLLMFAYVLCPSYSYAYSYLVPMLMFAAQGSATPRVSGHRTRLRDRLHLVIGDSITRPASFAPQII